MQLGRLRSFILTAALAGALATSAQAGPRAVIANFTSGFDPGTVTILDTATDQPVGGPIKVGVNPAAVVITPDGKTAVVACAYTADLWFIDLSATPPSVIGTLPVGESSNNTFFPGGLAMSPDGQYVVVTALGVTADPVSGNPLTPQTNLVKVVNVKNRSIAQTTDVSQLPDAGGGTLSAQMAAISSKGAIVLATADPSAPALYSLHFADGQIDIPDSATNNGQLKGFTQAQATNVAISPDGGTAIVPAGRKYVHIFSINDADELTETSPGGQGIASGGDGAQSVAITADGKLAYVLNLLPPGNITVFKLGGSTMTPANLQLKSSAMPAEIALLGGLPVGNQMIAVTPDGSKIYTVNPYSAGLMGELEVFAAGKPDAIAHPKVGVNPYAIAIQPQ